MFESTLPSQEADVLAIGFFWNLLLNLIDFSSRSFKSMVINEDESCEASSLLPSHTCTYYGL